MLVYLTLKNNKNQWTGFYLIGTSVMKDLNTFKAAGIDQFPVKFLKEAADVLAYPLATSIVGKTICISRRKKNC